MRRTCKSCFYALFLALLTAATTAAQSSFQWDWRRAEYLTCKQCLREAKLTKAERAAISKAITDQLRPDMYGEGFESEEHLENIALDARIKLVDLNGDGTPEVIRRERTLMCAAPPEIVLFGFSERPSTVTSYCSTQRASSRSQSSEPAPTGSETLSSQCTVPPPKVN